MRYFVMLFGLLALSLPSALAQTTAPPAAAPGTPTAPGAGTATGWGYGNWWWIVVVIIVVLAVIWFVTKGRGRGGPV